MSRNLLTMNELSEELKKDVERIQELSIVPSILELVCRITGMGFSAVARVTDSKWIACAVKDEINFGLRPGGQLELETTICNEIKGHGQPVVIDEVAKDDQFCNHHTPRQYGFQSYISIPIILKDGVFFGTLCAIDPRPFPLKSSNMVTLFTLFADLIAYHLLTHDRMRAQKELLTTKDRQIRQSADEIRQYSHISSHTLREPLRKLRLFTDKLIHLEDIPEEHQAKQIALKINRLSGSFTQMISELSEFSGLDAAPANWEPVDLNAIADDVRISLRPMVVEKNAIVTVGALPIIEAKPVQMTQLFAHLVRNALQFSRPDVQPAISILADKLPAAEVSLYEELDLTRLYCRLRFEDNGIGIEQNQLHDNFDLFRWFGTDGAQPDLGAGLAQVKKIVQLHNGALNVRSEPGSGSVFTVILPMRQPPN
jgi:signal transduction histidine kinase